MSYRQVYPDFMSTPERDPGDVRESRRQRVASAMNRIWTCR
jgi:hypothetical protein